MNTIGFLSFEPWYILEETPISADILYFDKLMFSSMSIETSEFLCSHLPLRPIDKDLVKRKMNELDLYMKHGLVEKTLILTTLDRFKLTTPERSMLTTPKRSMLTT
jgi:hypothetical protein